MKKGLTAVAIALLISIGTQAQQTSTHKQHLMLTVYENYSIGGKSHIIQTREDGSQMIRDFKWKVPTTFDRYAAHEDSLILLLKPFFDEGWDLVSSSPIQSGVGYDSGIMITRYFLRREQP
jgi:hypothetical protein